MPLQSVAVDVHVGSRGFSGNGFVESVFSDGGLWVAPQDVTAPLNVVHPVVGLREPLITCLVDYHSGVDEGLPLMNDDQGLRHGVAHTHLGSLEGFSLLRGEQVSRSIEEVVKHVGDFSSDHHLPRGTVHSVIGFHSMRPRKI